MSSLHLKFYILILHIMMEETLSQNFNSGLGFYFVESRIKTKPEIKSLRYGSLYMDVLDVCIKCYYNHVLRVQ